MCAVHVVLSETASAALRLYSDTEETANFVSKFDKFFDCLNVSNFLMEIVIKNHSSIHTEMLMISD